MKSPGPGKAYFPFEKETKLWRKQEKCRENVAFAKSFEYNLGSKKRWLHTNKFF